jgi:phenylalanyl-tRNA synthetase beta chain
VGNVFFNTGREDSQPDECEMLAGLMTGLADEDSWLSKGRECDFYDIKGAVEELLRSLFIKNIKFTRLRQEDCCYTRQGYTASLFVENKFIGILGEVHPRVLKNYDLKQKAYIFEFDADNLINLIPDVKSAEPLPKFPSTSRDITLIVDKDIEALNIIKSVEVLNEKLVENLYLFDAYEGAPIPADKKSISFRITYRSAVETLEDETINLLHSNITGRLIKEFGAALPA